MLPFRKSALPNTLATVIPASFFIVVVGFAFGAPWIVPEFILFVAAWYLSSRRDQALSERASRSASPLWSVSMGGVPIGNLSDARYAALYRAALRDWRTAVRHGLGLMRWLVGFAGRIAWLVPLLFFGLSHGSLLRAPMRICQWSIGLSPTTRQVLCPKLALP